MNFWLKRDGVLVFTGTFIDGLNWIHRNHSFSLDWALRYEGYTMACARCDGLGWIDWPGANSAGSGHVTCPACNGKNSRVTPNRAFAEGGPAT